MLGCIEQHVRRKRTQHTDCVNEPRSILSKYLRVLCVNAGPLLNPNGGGVHLGNKHHLIVGQLQAVYIINAYLINK